MFEAVSGSAFLGWQIWNQQRIALCVFEGQWRNIYACIRRNRQTCRPSLSNNKKHPAVVVDTIRALHMPAVVMMETIFVAFTECENARSRRILIHNVISFVDILPQL
jgi:hypothetical protein